jgi:DNA-binding CsgD family transcriptional regulator
VEAVRSQATEDNEARVKARARHEWFFGRAKELEALTSALAEAKSGQLRVVYVEGEAGLGKTALVRRFLESAAELVRLQASGAEPERQLAWGLVRQLARSRGSGVGGGQLWLAKPPVGVDAFAVGAQVLELLGELQQAGPVVLVVDDLQWADDESSAALVFVLRRLACDRVLVVLCARPAEDLGDGWRRLARDPAVTVLRLEGLSVEELGALAKAAGRVLPHHALEALRAHTEGNPLWARALLDELGPEHLGGRSGLLPAPRDFASVVLARLARCPLAARLVVEAGAVLGTRCELATAVALSGIEDTAQAVAAALGSGLVREVAGPGGGDLAFSHELVRAAVYHDLHPERRLALHRSAATLLRGDRALAHRVAASVGADEALAGDLERAAKAHLGRGEVALAASQLHRSALLSADLLDRERRFFGAFGAWLAEGDLSAANRASGELEGLPDSPGRRYVEGAIALWDGRLEEAGQLLGKVWEATAEAPGGSQLAGASAAQLALLGIFALDGERALGWAQRALATGALAPGGFAFCCWARAEGLALLGLSKEALETFGQADQARLSRADVLFITGELFGYRDDPLRAASCLATALELARRGEAGQSLLAGHVATHLCKERYRLGEFAPAIESGGLALALAQQSDRRTELTFVHAMLSYPFTARGEFEEADEHVRSALQNARALGSPVTLGYAAAASANLAQARSQHERVLAQFRSLPQQAAPVGLGLLPVSDMAADAHLALGQLEEAEAAVKACERAAAASDRPLAQLAAWRVRGRLQAALGDAPGSCAAFEQALGLAATLGVPFEQARVRLAYGEALLKLGERPRARHQLASSRDAFQALGAEPLRQHAEALLPATGARPAGAGKAGASRLTARELAIARLVADGKSYKEVGAELYLTTKTVEYHLGHAYAKLGVRSRAELRSALASTVQLTRAPSGTAPSGTAPSSEVPTGLKRPAQD